jgi:hypothetical protein
VYLLQFFGLGVQWSPLTASGEPWQLYGSAKSKTSRCGRFFFGAQGLCS